MLIAVVRYLLRHPDPESRVHMQNVDAFELMGRKVSNTSLYSPIIVGSIFGIPIYPLYNPYIPFKGTTSLLAAAMQALSPLQDCARHWFWDASVPEAL